MTKGIRVGRREHQILQELGKGNRIVKTAESIVRTYGRWAGPLYSWKNNEYQLCRLSREQMERLFKKGLVVIKGSEIGVTYIGLSARGKAYLIAVNSGLIK